MTTTTTLPTVQEQAERLIELGLAERAGIAPETLRQIVGEPGDLLVIQADRLPPSVMTGFLSRQGKPGFVVEDMTDVDSFTPIPETTVPGSDVYLVSGLERGDEMSNWTPDEALPSILGAERTPLTLAEGMHWLIQQPEVLERNRCFMTIASRLRKPNGRLDARTPALWISNGTGRDGAVRKDAPKVGWCWAGNRHTWLGFASASGRRALG